MKISSTGVAVVSGVGLILVILLTGAYLIIRYNDKCAAAGGTQVKTYDGFKCVRAAVIKL